MRINPDRLSSREFTDLLCIGLGGKDPAAVARAWAEALAIDEVTAVRTLDKELRKSEHWWDWHMRYEVLAHVGAVDVLEELERQARVVAPYLLPDILAALGREEEAIATEREQIMLWPSADSLDEYVRRGRAVDTELQERVFGAMNVEGSILQESLWSIQRYRSKYPCAAADAALQTGYEGFIATLRAGSESVRDSMDLDVALSIAREIDDREALDLLLGVLGDRARGASDARAVIGDIVAAARQP